MSAIVFYIFYPFAWLLSFLPLRGQYLLSDLFSPVLFSLIRYRRKTVMNNLRNAFPEKSLKERRSIARRFYRHFCRLFIETLSLIHFTRKDIQKHVRIKNQEYLQELYQKKKSIIAVFGHYGNWEWMSALPVLTPFQVCAIYKPLSNKYFDRFYMRLREKFGTKTIPMALTLKKMVEYQNRDIPTFSLFLSDQRPIRRSIRYWTRFLNQATPVQNGAERIAKKTGQAVVFLNIQVVRPGQYEVECIPITEDPKNTEPFEITDAFTRILEKTIREKPEFWLWTHRRWRHNIDNYRLWAEKNEVKDTVYHL